MVSFPEQAQLFIAVKMGEILLTFPDCPRGTEGDAVPAAAAVFLKGMIVLQGKRGQNGYQADAGAVGRIDKQVVSAQPAKACCNGNPFMRQVSLLTLPVDNLGCGDGKRPVPALLDLQRQTEGNAVEEKICLAVVMQVKLGGPVVNIFQHGI
jgi:hypothetical protein